MATIGLQTAAFVDLMKTRYIDPINDQVVRAHVFLDRLEKRDNYEMSGNFAVIPLIMARNPAVGSRKDSAGGGPKLPAPGRQTYDAATYEIGLHYGSGSVSGAVMRKSKDKAGAFARALDIEMRGLLQSLPDDLNRQLTGIGNGRAGSLTSNQATSETMTFDSRDNFQVKVGDRVSFAGMTAGGRVLPAAGSTVTNIILGSGNTHTVILGTAAGTSMSVAIDALYFGGGETTGTTEDISWGSDIYGIQSVVDDGNIGADEQVISEDDETLAGDVSKFGGIERSSTPNWQSKVMHNPDSAGTARPLTETILFEAHLHAVSQGGAIPGDIELYMDVSTWGTLGMLQVGTRIYNDTKDTVAMGWEFITVNNAKAFYDRDLPRGKIFFLNMKSLFLLTQGGYEMIDQDGNVLRVISGGGRDAWEFAVVRDIQLAANNLRAHVLIRDIQTTMTVEGTTH